MEKQEAIQWLAEENDCTLSEYDGDGFVIVQSWDTVNHENFKNALEILGLDEYDGWGFSDEYSTCGECCNVIRTSPDSYSWIADYWLSDEGLFCGDCVRTNLADEYIDYCVESAQHGKAVSCNLVNPTDHAFSLIIEGLENGLHHGQNDNPTAIVEWAKPLGLSIVFVVRASQFHVAFDVYARKEYPETYGYIPFTETRIVEIQDALVESQTPYSVTLRDKFRQWPSPAQNCENALKNLSKPFAKIDPQTGNVEEFDTIEEYLTA